MTEYKREEIKDYALERIQELKDYDLKGYNQLVEDGELHNEIFNTDYYLIYTGEAIEWLGSHVFEAIGVIKDYENDNFGEEYTDCSDPVKIVNMFVYIVGETVLWEILEGVNQ